MSTPSWSKELSVGVHPLDTDHKLLLSLIDQLSEAVAAGQGHDTVGSVLNALIDYTDYHFGREEALMEACGYPELDEHRRVHAELTARVKEIRDLYAANPSMVLGEDLMAFLQSWLTDHIMDRDKDYAACMAAAPERVKDANYHFNDMLSLVDSEAEDGQAFLFDR